MEAGGWGRRGAGGGPPGIGGRGGSGGGSGGGLGRGGGRGGGLGCSEGVGGLGLGLVGGFLGCPGGGVSFHLRFFLGCGSRIGKKVGREVGALSGGSACVDVAWTLAISRLDLSA